jgi:hypothetical protein
LAIVEPEELIYLTEFLEKLQEPLRPSSKKATADK